MDGQHSTLSLKKKQELVSFHGTGETYGTPNTDELRVCFDLTIQHKLNIDRWIEIALMKKVKMLELDFTPCIQGTLSVTASGQFLESLLSNCPLLETMHVSHSMQFTDLNVGAYH
ncbi:Regulator of chromosome condensation, RCC1 [Gossypium australe]|uniref:Regulator of chromosome condensation, RCC1 n=1 Tax=Gossypium australe TaxID=47621 RepID=A0A5B6X0E8_9ROSI|nr:Regulator of chromosome condensation, RCC1 [Gossypium australe]